MFKLIKQIFQKNKNAYIVVIENEKPLLVIQSFEEYQKIFGGNSEHKKADEVVGVVKNPTDNSVDDLFDFTGGEDELESLNREIMTLQTSSGPDVEISGGSQRETENARIEDIPVM